MNINNNDFSQTNFSSRHDKDLINASIEDLTFDLPSDFSNLQIFNENFEEESIFTEQKEQLLKLLHDFIQVQYENINFNIQINDYKQFKLKFKEIFDVKAKQLTPEQETAYEIKIIQQILFRYGIFINTQLHQLLKEIEKPEKSQQSWLNWMIEGFTGAREHAEITFVTHFKEKIDKLNAQLEKHDVQQFKNKDLEKLIEKFKVYSEKIKEIQNDFPEFDTYYKTLERVSDQTISLIEGEQNFSIDAYQELFQHANKLLPFKHRAETVIKKDIFLIEDFTEELFAAMHAEHSECMMQWRSAFSKRPNLDYLIREYAQLQSTIKACQLIVEKFKKIKEDCQVPLLQPLIKNDLKTAQTLLKKLNTSFEQINADLSADKGIRDKILSSKTVFTQDEIKHVRMAQPAFSRAQKYRQQNSIRLSQQSEPKSESHKLFYNCFFFYLQAISPSLIANFGTPVGQKDYPYYLHRMAETVGKANGSEENYHDYLEKARSFWSADQEFLDYYDDFLRNQESIFYVPEITQMQQTPTLDNPKKNSIEQTYAHIQESAPKAVAEWTAKFLGINSEGRMVAQTNGWDQWLQTNVLPQVRENYFNHLVHYFDQINDRPPPVDAGRTTEFGYQCFQLYRALKIEGTIPNFILLNEQFPEFRPFISDYQNFLSTYSLPHVNNKFEHILVSQIVNSNSSALVAKEPIVKTAVKVKQTYFSTWPEKVANYLFTFRVKQSDQVVADPQVKPLEIPKKVVYQEIAQIQKKLEQIDHIEKDLLFIYENIPTLFDEESQNKFLVLAENVTKLKEQLEFLKENQPTNRSTTGDWLRKVYVLESDIETALEKVQQFNLIKQKESVAILQKIVEGPSINVTDRLLLHTLGDSFGKDSGLEGANPADTLDLFINLVNVKALALDQTSSIFPKILQDFDIKPDFPLPIIDDLQLKLESAKKLWQSLSKSPHHFKEELLSQLKTIENSDSVFMPGGWGGKPGHAVYYEFIKQNHDQFSFRVYNTGAGLENSLHGLTALKFNRFALTFLEINEITLESLVAPLFLNVLHELFFTSFTTNEEPFDQDDFYHAVISLLNGNIRTEGFTSDQLRLPQNSGTCAMASLFNILSHRHSVNQISKINFELGLKSLVDYESYFRNEIKNGYNELRTQLLAKTTQSFAIEIEKLHKKGVINELEYIYASQILAQIQTTYQQGLHHFSHKPSQEVSFTAKLPIRNNLILDLDQKLFSFSTYFGLSQPKNVINCQDWILQPSTLLDDLSLFQKEIELAQSHDQHLDVSNSIINIFEKMEIEDLVAPLTSFSDKNKIQFIHTVTGLITAGIQSQIALTKIDSFKLNKIDPNFFLAQLKAWTFSHLLTMQILDTEDTSFLFDKYLYDNFINKTTLWFRFYNPNADQSFKFIKNYFNKLKNLESDFVITNETRDYHNGRILSLESNKNTDKILHKIINFPGIRENIEKTNPKLLNEPLIKIFSDLWRGRHPLPDFVLDLRALSIQLKFISENLIPTVKIDVDYRSYCNDYDRCELAVSVPRITKISVIGDHLKFAHSSLEKNKILHSLHKKYGYISEFERYSPDELILNSYFFVLDNKLDTSLQEMRELLSINSFAKTQISSLLDYYILNPDLFKNPDYRIFFKALLFDSENFLNEMTNDKNNTFFLSQLSRFFNEQYQLHRALGNWDAVADVLHFSDLVAWYRNSIYNANRNEINPALPSAASSLREILTVENLSNEQKANLSLQLALTYHHTTTSLSMNEAAELITSLIRYFPNRLNQKTEQVFSIERVMNKHQSRLLELLSGENKDAFLNQVINNLSPNMFQQTWKAFSHFPLYCNQDASIIVNVLTGELFDDLGFYFSTLDSHTLNHVDLLSLTEPPKHVSRKNFTTFGFTDAKGEDYLIQTREDGYLNIQKKINGEWHVNLTKRLLKIPMHEGLLLNNQFWLKLPKNTNPDNTFFSNLFKYFSKEIKPEIKVFQADGKTQICTIELNSNLDSIQSISKDYEDHSLYLSSRSYDFVNNFELSTMVLSWVDAEHHLKLIDFPRFNLSFEIRENKAFSKNHPGFFISSLQDLPELKGYPHFLILENSQKEKLILLPFQKISPQKEREGNLETLKIFPNREIENFNQSYIEYKLSRGSKKIEAASIADSVYLASIFLWKFDYQSAFNYLKDLDVMLQPFTEKEVEGFLSLVNLADISFDRSPKAIAVYAYARYLLEKNRSYFSTTQFKLKPFNETEYIEKIDYMGDLKLTAEEEIFLLQKTKGNSAVALHRLKYLLSEESNEHLVFYTPLDLPPYSSITTVKYLNRENYISAVQKYLNDYGHLKTKKIAPPLSLLRISIVDNFKSIYQLIKGELQDKEADEAFEFITRLPNFSSNPVEGIKKLSLILDLQLKNKEPLLQVLRALILEPDSFPTFTELNNLYRTDPNFANSFFPPSTYMNLKNKLPTTTIKMSPITLSDPQQAQIVEEASDVAYQMCINPYSPTAILQPLLPNVRETIDKVNVAHQESSTDFEQLIKVFETPVKSRIVEREFLNVKENFENYQKQDKETTLLKEGEIFKVNALDKFIAQQFEIEQQLEVGSRDLYELEKQLVELVNKKNTSLDKASALFDEIRDNRSLDIDQLINLYLTRDSEEFYKRNTSLSLAEIDQLNQQMTQYLIQSTHLQHLRRICKKMTEVQIAQREEKPLNEVSQLIEELILVAESVRAYDVYDNPAYLVFEHYTNILFRPLQIKNLDLLQIKDGQIKDPEKIGTVIQAIMGSGKTEVLLPLLGKLCANGENLCFGVIPEALIQDMSLRLSVILGKTFKQSVDVFKFRRDQKLTLDDFHMLELRFQQSIKMKRLLITDPTSIQNLYLKLWEAWRNYANHQDEKNKKILDSLRNIMRVFKNSGLALVDESDTVFNARKDFQFAFGELKSLDTYEIELMTHLYKIILNPAIVPQMNFELNSTRSDTEAFTLEDYQNKIVPKLIKQIIEDKFALQDKELISFFDRTTQAEKRWIELYLSDSQDVNVLNYVSNIKNETIKNLLALSKEQIQRLLPLTLNKKCDLYYGKSPKTETFTAIPYHGSNAPSVNSTYEVYETLNYTIQLYLIKELPQEMVLKEILDLKSKALILINKKKSYLDSEIYKRFLVLTGGNKQIKLLTADQHIEEITNYINDHQDLKIELVKKYALSQITQQMGKMSANAQIFNFVFRQLAGFTGTQWNAETFPNKLTIHSSDETTGSTLEVLWKNSRNKIYLFTPQSTQHLFSQLFEKYPHFKNAQAFIDTGAFTKGFSNESIARQWLSQTDATIKGVVYYDEQENLKVIEKNQTNPIPFTQCKLQPHERKTFYDQRHTTGANILQAPNAKAFVTIGNETIFRDFAQAVWRMRGIRKGQKVEFIIDKEVDEIIKANLKSIQPAQEIEKIELKHLLLFISYNQAMLKGDNNFRSLKQKLNAVQQEAVLSALISPDVQSEDLIETYFAVSKLCVTENTLTAWELFGQPQVEKESSDIIDHLVLKQLDSSSFQAFETDPTLKNYVNQEKVKQTIMIIAEKTKPLVHERILSSANNYHTESELQIETEKEVETEVQKEVETEELRYAYSEISNRTVLKPTLVDMGSVAYFNEKPHGNKEAKFIHLPTALSSENDLEKFKDVFHPALIATLDLIKKHDLFISDLDEKNKYEVNNYKLFNYYQKSITDILVTQDKNTKKLKFVLGDANDGLDWNDLVDELNQLPHSQRPASETNWAIAKIGLGIYKLGFDGKEIKDCEESEEFQTLFVQAKFFNGEINYTDQELSLLKTWIEKNGQEKMRQLFGHILAWKDKNQQRLKTSDIYQLLWEK